MGGIYVDFSVNNQLNSPALNSNTFANRPAAGQIGRLFISTDTFEIYRDNGTSWDLIGGPGSSTITGSGVATQVAYFTGAQAITGNNNLWFNPTNAHLGIGTNAPSGLLHADGGANVARIILDADNNVARILSFRTADIQRWSFRVDGNETGGNAGANLQFRRYDDAGNFIDNSLVINRATGKKTFNATQNYTTGLATGNTMGFNLNVPAGTTFSSPNNITALQASFLLNLAGNATMPSGVRSGLEGYNFVNFTGPGTLTVSQAGTGRQLSNIKSGWAFTGSAIGTITHLSGISILFPDNVGSAINITNNYALYINDQNAGLGIVNYTNRWGIYQEGSADLNYLNGNLLIKSTVDNGNALQVTGQATISGNVGIGVTPAPSVRLNVVSSSQVLKLSTAANQTHIEFSDTTNSKSGFLNYNNDNLIYFRNGPIPTLTIDASGNLGLGVTPSAWGSNVTAIELPQSVSLYSWNASAVPQLYLGANHYWDGSAWRYKFTGQASTLYYQAVGQHQWYTAPSGTAGNAITFTQAMTLDASGNLLINTTSLSSLGNGVTIRGDNDGANGFGYIQMSGSGSATVGAYFYNNTGLVGSIGTDGTGFVFRTSGSDTERMRITSGGNVLVGTTTDAGQRLQVNGGVLIGAGLRMSSNSTEGEIVANLGRGLKFYTNDGNSNPLNMTSGGNVLIGTGTDGASKVRIVGLPTSSAGLSPGDLWNDGGTLKIA